MLSHKADFRHGQKVGSQFQQNFHRTEQKSLKCRNMPPYCHSTSERGDNSESDKTKSRFRQVSAKEIKIIDIAGIAIFWWILHDFWLHKMTLNQCFNAMTDDFVVLLCYMQFKYNKGHVSRHFRWYGYKNIRKSFF